MFFQYMTDMLTNNAPIVLWGAVSLSLGFVVKCINFTHKNTQQELSAKIDLELIQEDHIMETLSNICEHFDFTCYKLLISTAEDIIIFRQLLKSDYDKLAFNPTISEEANELLSEYYAILYSLTHVIENLTDIFSAIS